MITTNYDAMVEANTLLDCIYERLLGDDVFNAMHYGGGVLQNLHNTVPPVVWQKFTQNCLNHPLKDILHQDPLTWRSFQKPRGYAGDAVMLDYIYSNSTIPANTTELGRQIFNYTRQASAPRTVCARRDVLADKIDYIANETKKAHVFSIACGHLREAQIAASVAEGRLGRFAALDSDEESLRLVQQEQPKIETIQGSVRSLLTGKIRLSNFDLVYAAGLYDYLVDPIAKRLTALMFNMLNSGGRVLIANFAPTTRDIGYMETYMGWHLIYRTEAEMQLLVEEIPKYQIKAKRIFWEKNQNAVFLEIIRR